MANVLGNILKGAGDIAGGLYGGIVDYGRRYTYGPDYEENQQLRREQANASLEAQKARKEYYEALKKQAEEKAKNNPQMKQKLADINRGIDILTGIIGNPTFQKNPELLNRANKGLDSLFNYMNSMVNGQEQPLPVGNESSFAPPGVQYNWNIKTPEQRIGMMFNPTTNIPIEQKPTGALANVGPPMPTGYNQNIPENIKSYVPQGVQSTWSAMTPEQRTSSMLGQTKNTIVQNISPPGLESIWNSLDEQSKEAAKQLLAQGASAQDLIEHYKKKMGK